MPEYYISYFSYWNAHSLSDGMIVEAKDRQEAKKIAIEKLEKMVLQPTVRIVYSKEIKE